jgi:hypothetical protein
MRIAQGFPLAVWNSQVRSMSWQGRIKLSSLKLYAVTGT